MIHRDRTCTHRNVTEARYDLDERRDVVVRECVDCGIELGSMVEPKR